MAFLGSGALVWLVWMISTGMGVVVGDITEPEWQLGFAVPLLFGGLMIISITNRAGIVAGRRRSRGGPRRRPATGFRVLARHRLGVVAGGIADTRLGATPEATP